MCLIILSSGDRAGAQIKTALIQLQVDSGITLSIDEPTNLDSKKPTELIIFALPNGNTTAQTFGRKLAPGDDWHFDIQHIGAQTAFIRNADPAKNYIVVYAENTLKSWPAWRKKFAADGDTRIVKLVELLRERYKAFKPTVALTCHSGGGSFLFGFLNVNTAIPAYVNKIGFLDATYGYETEKHFNKLNSWLKNKRNRLEIIAYNDSVVVYDGKPLVSPTGGTWYRSKLMAHDLGFKTNDANDRLIFGTAKDNTEAILIKNPEAKIYHTVLVEKNGFIHLIFSGTPLANKNYTFWGERAYSAFIK